MTDQELSLKIAEYLGWTEIQECTCSSEIYSGISPERIRKHIDMVNNPAMTAMLIDKVLTSSQLDITIQRRMAIGSRPIYCINRRQESESESLGRSVALFVVWSQEL